MNARRRRMKLTSSQKIQYGRPSVAGVLAVCRENMPTKICIITANRMSQYSDFFDSLCQAPINGDRLLFTGVIKKVACPHFIAPLMSS
jgi:hypothetical protein